MDTLKHWVALSVVACLAVLAAGWFLLVSPQRAEAGDLKLAAEAQEVQNTSLRTQLQVLAHQARELPAQQARLDEVGRQIPPGVELPTLLRSLEQTAQSNDVELVDIAPSPPVPLAAAAAPADPAVAGATAAPGISVVTVNLSAVGGYFPLQQFLAGLEGSTRATRVTSLSLAPGVNPVEPAGEGALQDGRVLVAALTLEVYVDGRTTATAPVTPAPAGAAPTTTGPSPVVPPAGTTTAPVGATPPSGQTGAGAATAPASAGTPAAGASTDVTDN